MVSAKVKKKKKCCYNFLQILLIILICNSEYMSQFRLFLFSQDIILVFKKLELSHLLHGRNYAKQK